jgi:uncharacterized membrane protein YhaH (DUF805 family)
MFFRNNLLLGGNNGFTDFKFILGHDLVGPVDGPVTQRWLYIVTGVTLLIVFLFCRWLSTTKFGLVQRAIRDGENRVLFSGYAAANFKLFIFVFSAVIASIGGALYTPQVGGINPSAMTPEKSLEAVVWVAVGGRGTLAGPIVGAVFVSFLKTWATREFPALWLIILGLLFIVVVLFLPGGLVSFPRRVRETCAGLSLRSIHFSLRGRVPRATFLYVSAGASVCALVCIGAIRGGASMILTSLAVPVLAVVSWILLAVNVKRLHDLGRSGALAALYLAPVGLGLDAALGADPPGSLSVWIAALLGIAWWACLGVLAGTAGPNRHGPDMLVSPDETPDAADAVDVTNEQAAPASGG